MLRLKTMHVGTRGIKRAVLGAFAIFLVSGCRGVADFWTSYRADAIVDRKSDQGAWGGERWILWHASPGTFVPSDAAAFARSHGWTCDAPVFYRQDQLLDWVSGGQPVFPFFYPQGSGNLRNSHFPRRIQSESSVIRCGTGWTRVEPGTGRSSAAYGYIHVSADGQDMAVYHLWGEA